MLSVIVLNQAKRELKKFPKKALVDSYALFDELKKSNMLAMPASKPLSNIAKGLHELRQQY